MALPTNVAAQTFNVDSTQGWQTTSLNVTEGQQLSLSASGSWNVDHRNFSFVGPDGYSPEEDSRIFQGCKLDPQLPYGVLLARIGGAPSFLVIGSDRTFTADRDGTLAFRIHDGDACLGDNAGSVQVTVALIAPPPQPGPPPAPQPPPPPPPTALADLSPTEILFNSAELVSGRTVFFDSGVRNSGAQGTGVFNIKWFVNGQEVGAYGSHGGVPAGQTVLDGNTQFSWTFDSPGTHSVTFSVDVDNHIAESNESNNSRSVTVAVIAAAPPPPAPEPPPTTPPPPPQCTSQLTVPRVWTRDVAGTDKATFAPGETIQFAAELSNSYGAALLAANGTRLTVTTSFFNNTRPVDIPPGISTWTWNATAPSTGGSHAVTVRAFDHFCGTLPEGSASFSVGANPPQPPTTPPTTPQPPQPPPERPPTITLVGDNPLYVTQGCPFIDPTATATDAQGNDLTEQITVTGSVDVNSPGGYILTYSVTDSRGLSDTKTRQVIVFGVISTTPPCVFDKPTGRARNLIVLVHGCCTGPDGVEDWRDLGNTMLDKIRNRNAWEIVVWDWHKNEETGDVQTPPPPPWDLDNIKDYADIAYTYADVEGRQLADAINQRGVYEYIHLIAHSAGAKLIDKAAKWLSVLKKRKNGEKPFIHLTFLDAYTPNKSDKKGKGSYGSLPNNYLKHYSEHYVDRPRGFFDAFCASIDAFVASTDAILPHAFNFDITNWKSKHPLRKKSLCGHNWPRYWYEKSVTSGFRYGYRLSREGGSKYETLAEKYRKGEKCPLKKTEDECPK